MFPANFTIYTLRPAYAAAKVNKTNVPFPIGELLVPPGAWFELDPLAPSPEGGGGGPCARLIWAIAKKLRAKTMILNILNIFFILLVFKIYGLLNWIWFNLLTLTGFVNLSVYEEFVLTFNKYLSCKCGSIGYYFYQIISGAGVQVDLHLVIAV